MAHFREQTPGARRRLGWSALLLSAWLLPAPVAAQIPGDELPTMSRARNEFLAATYSDVKELLGEWQELYRKADGEKLARLFTEDGLYYPVDGWYVQGRSEVSDSLAARAPRIKGYHTSLLDFTASGGLVYYLGRMSYRLEGPRPVDVAGIFVMVLYQQGRRWRIRSYIERSTADF